MFLKWWFILGLMALCSGHGSERIWRGGGSLCSRIPGWCPVWRRGSGPKVEAGLGGSLAFWQTVETHVMRCPQACKPVFTRRNGCQDSVSLEHGSVPCPWPAADKRGWCGVRALILNTFF